MKLLKTFMKKTYKIQSSFWNNLNENLSKMSIFFKFCLSPMRILHKAVKSIKHSKQIKYNFVSQGPKSRTSKIIKRGCKAYFKGNKI